MTVTSAGPSATDEALGDLHLLNLLDARLASHQTEVEFYFVGGAVIFQAFNAQPGTAHVSAMFRPADVVRLAIEEVAIEEGAPEDWLPQSVRRVLRGGATAAAYVGLPHVRVFVPVPDYVLGIKCAAMRLGDDFREMDDIRYLLRAMNVTSADSALSIVSQYFTERQLAPDTKARLERALAPDTRA